MSKSGNVNRLRNGSLAVLGCIVASLAGIERKKEFKENQAMFDNTQAMLDSSIKFQLNGKDTTVTYNLTGKEIKSLIEYEEANRLKFK